MKTFQNSVKDITIGFNDESFLSSVVFEDTVLTGQLLRSLMYAVGLPYTSLNLSTYTQTNSVAPLFNEIADRPFLSVRKDNGELASFVGLDKGWVSDAEFAILCQKFEERLGLTRDPHLSIMSGAVELKASYKIEDGLTSIGDKSLYSSYFTITRLAEGGVSGDSSLFRLACANGMTVPARYSDRIKIKSFADVDKFVNKAVVQSKATLMNAIDEQLFDSAGRPFMASVREFRAISKLIDSYVEVPNQFLNREYVDKFYADRGYDSHIQNFPSGMTYFDIYNVATNAFSNVIKDVPLTDANIALGTLLFSKRDASAGIQDIDYTPVFDNVEAMRGDIHV